jgi:tetratricopeptide (TPR) repeat protein
LRAYYRGIAGVFAGIALMAHSGAAGAQDKALPTSNSVVTVLVKSLCDGLTFVPVKWNGRDYQYCLRSTPNGGLNIAISDPIGFDKTEYPVTMDDATKILTNKRYSPLHKQLSEWVGVGFEKLRQRLANRAYPESVGSNNLLAMQRGRNSILLSKNNDLRSLGYFDKALTQLDPVLARYPGDKKKLSDDKQWEWTSFTLAKASTLVLAGRLDDAVKVCEDFERQPLIDQSWKANTAINRAAYLAEAGRFKESLAALDFAQSVFDGSVPVNGGYKLDGSNREFMWIRACALHGLGRREEVSSLITSLYAMPEQLTSYSASMTPTMQIKIRLVFCMEDTDALVDIVRQNVVSNSPLPMFATQILQSGYQLNSVDRSVFIERVRNDPRLRDIMAQVEQLPPESIPAVKRWRVTSAKQPASPKVNP